MDRAKLQAAFESALYTIETPGGPRDFRIGGPVAGIHDSFAMLTAFNPGGAEQTASENEAANDRLFRLLSFLDYPVVAGASRDLAGRHEERQFAVFGMDKDEALGLARQFGQAAIVWFDGSVASLAWA